MVSKIVYYIDPLHDSENNQIDYDSVFDNWCKFCQEFTDLKNINWIKQNITTQTQQDGVSCGVYVCKFFEQIKNNNFDFTTLFNIPEFRRVIDCVLFKN